MAFWAMVHTTAHYVNFINVERTRKLKFVYPTRTVVTLAAEIRPQIALQIHYTQPGGITGHFMLLIMLLIYTTAAQKIRHQCFEVFWYTHHLAFFFILGLYTHATGCFVRDSANPTFSRTFPFYNPDHCLGYMSWRFTIWPGILYFGERAYREFRARRATRLSGVLIHPSGPYLTIDQSGGIFTSFRRDGIAYREAELQLYPRPVVVHSGAGNIALPMAPRGSWF
jgi:NADPH oxidase